MRKRKLIYGSAVLGFVAVAILLILVVNKNIPGQGGKTSPRNETIMQISASFSSDVLSNDWLAKASEVVVIGTVKSISNAKEINDTRARESIIGRDVVVSVEKVLKGKFVTPGSELQVRTLGGTIGEKTVIAEAEPKYDNGEKVLLFLTRNGLYMPSEGNIYTALAGMHGKFSIKNDKGIRDERLPEGKREFRLQDLVSLVAKNNR
ncbi:MAG: hypothetical protein QME63_01030 [Actinomycetota bacterium]|nr:hypothetical protein [Actinomycetota bacterium]